MPQVVYKGVAIYKHRIQYVYVAETPSKKVPSTSINAGLEARFSGVNFTQMRLHDLLKAADMILIDVESTPYDHDLLLQYRAVLKALITELEPLVPSHIWDKWVVIMDNTAKAIATRKIKWMRYANNALWLLHRYIISLMQDYQLLYKLKKRRTLTDDASILDKYVKAEIG